MSSPQSVKSALLRSDVDRLMSCSDWYPFLFNDHDDRILGILPRWVIVVGNDGDIVRLDRQAVGRFEPSVVSVPLREALAEGLATLPSLPTEQSGFTGGMAGWLGYDLHSDSSEEHDKLRPDFPKACIAGFDAFIRLPAGNDQPATLHAATEELHQRIRSRLNSRSAIAAFSIAGNFRQLMPADEYAKAFRQVQAYLHSGDCYQVNLAQAFQADCTGSGLEAFQHLDSISHPPYAAYLSSPYGEILSLSPELFLQFEHGRVTTRPIKGTRPRGLDAMTDDRMAADLASHPKDRAENLMIVDLLRNDLGKHAITGSVQVNDLFLIESFAHVHHMTSEIECCLRPDSHPLDMLLDAFPGGSITGAPKRRAMEIIDELENFGRSVYCGSIGYLTSDGRGEWNIAIRTLLKVGDTLFAWAGGGIVADSVCEDEYQECFNKIGPLLTALEERFGKR
ncbi:para-aminobenzoate synthetase component 1 [Fluviicoccus keumensis]|uniref:Para-aminobenzoate synthetase component 1 n=1 Tax=Fluviicoccus keumensis TaxID=1435465 RepID=A0A4V2G5H3_9GAMM|nr:aminodeoxychorismate synthase component I [Fluviicoccus keumensis]RZU44866.1 para-aminobenzoate synthetase component 1 [Fluviicoccus keumensis]